MKMKWFTLLIVLLAILTVTHCAKKGKKGKQSGTDSSSDSNQSSGTASGKTKGKGKPKKTTPPPTAAPTTTTPPPVTTTPPPLVTTTPPPVEPSDKPPACDKDFEGFGVEPTKCGCCPWPCNCKCIRNNGYIGGDYYKNCKLLLDAVFILDASGSIKAKDWEEVTTFFGKVVSNLKMIGTNQHVAAITFAGQATLQWNLDDPETSSQSAVIDAIDNLPKSGGKTNIAAALDTATDEVFVPPGDNPDADNIAVLMTDGKSNVQISDVPDAAARIRDKARTICIAVTDDFDLDELFEICDEANILTVKDYSSLQSILGSLQSKICPPPKEEECFCCCTLEQFYGWGCY